MITGSFRNGSLNVRLARAIEKQAPASLEFKDLSIKELPHYNADLEGDRPAVVNDFTDAISAADAVCIVTPEYNRSIPGVLKNAIDWASKPMDSNYWKNKPIAMTGTSPGSIGTAVGQQHLRQILSILGAYVMPGEAYISFQPDDLIDEDGNITVPRSEKFISNFATRFAGWIDKLNQGGLV
jgi:chromate reductase